jgi:hypothetical protein
MQTDLALSFQNLRIQIFSVFGGSLHVQALLESAEGHLAIVRVFKVLPIYVFVVVGQNVEVSLVTSHLKYFLEGFI